jgi:hypothetical protein
LLCEDCLESLGLGDRARETVEQKPAATAEASGPLSHQGHDDVIGDQFTPPRGLQSGLQGRARFALTLGGSENVARG